MNRLIGYALLTLCWLLRMFNYVFHPGELAFAIEERFVCRFLGHVYDDDDKIEKDGMLLWWCGRCTHKQEASLAPC